ncbi:MAG: alkaline phosphatase family protein, partial [Candidatus Methylomirabilis sp.]|nr:alkaline phosphatase family protein [Deltaproteobacteria bacterium]
MNPTDIFSRLVLNHDYTRREALRHLARLGGAAAIAPLVNACGNGSSHDALLAGPGVQDLRPEDLRDKLGPIVFLMQENRSFDHYYGSLSLLEGRADVDGLTGAEVNLLPDGTPVHPAKLTEPCVFDPRHSWGAQRIQFAGGANSGFVAQHYEEVEEFLADIGKEGDVEDLAQHAMRHHTRDQLPYYYAIADEFAICNRWFSSLMSSTWGNRFYFLGAENEGHKGNDDEILLAGGLKGDLILDRLDDAGVPWRYYFVDVPPLALYVEKYLRDYASRSFN